MAPPAAAAAKLYAVVKSPWAVMATGSPLCSVPVSTPGGNPVIEAAGHTPTSPVTSVSPVLATAGVAARIPKLQAVPNGTGAVHAVVDVVNVHTKSVASGSPARSRAPVVMVAVYKVSRARGLVGVKVATSLDAT